ncbi:hypothetical protein OIU78_024134 [Salix suchowensis]|nr:hypothetical protein OIU78_024134 [Salix suchowensis]
MYDQLMTLRRFTLTSRRSGGLAMRGRGFTLWWTGWLLAVLRWRLAGLLAGLLWGRILHLSFLLLTVLRWCLIWMCRNVLR